MPIAYGEMAMPEPDRSRMIGAVFSEPWMDDKLKTAKDLLFYDDKLTYEERKELWGLLQYVMSNPKS
jgi:hypothetical protein